MLSLRGWNSDRYFDGGSALNWSGDLEVVGTDDPDLYLTQRSGSGPGKRAALPTPSRWMRVESTWFGSTLPSRTGVPGRTGGDRGATGLLRHGGGEILLEDLDIFAEVGELTALVKQAEVDVQDGELNLSFTASEGEPIVAAVEILQPAR